MNTLQLFPTEIFWWDWDGDVNQLLEHTKKQNIVKDLQVVDQSEPDVHKREGYESLFFFIKNCLVEIKDHYQLHCDGLDITTSWINRYRPYSHIHFHKHPMSAFSGVFFLTQGSPLALREPNYFKMYPSTIPIASTDKEIFELEPIPGRVVIFPWWLEHGSLNNRNEERWSIAFNSMPYGKVNYDDGRNLSSAYIKLNE